MDAAHRSGNGRLNSPDSGTGVFYQAMPAIGADGKNIMKLIPVQMVNRRFVQTAASRPGAERTQQKAAAGNILLSAAHREKTPSHLLSRRPGCWPVAPPPQPGAPPPQVDLDLWNKQLQQTVNVTAKVSPMATLSANGVTSVRRHPPPRGQDLHISPPPRGQDLHISPPPRGQDLHISPPPRGQDLHISPPTRGQNLHISPPPRGQNLHISPPPRGQDLHISPPAPRTEPPHLPPARGHDLHISPPPRGQDLHISPPPRGQDRHISPPPRGQDLHISPDTHIRTVLASKLPPEIQEQIFTSSPGGPGSPGAVYVSPVTMVTPSAAPPADSAPHSPAEASRKTSPGLPPKETKPHLKLIPKVSHRANSPTRWVIEEHDSAPSPKPLHSASVTSEILCVVAEREKPGRDQDSDGLAPGSGAGGRDEALVVCNGKVFFVTNKSSLPLKPAEPTRRYRLNRTAQPSADTQQNLRQEVIDLCDDDAQEEASVCQLEEDNVIFISYTPPRTEGPRTHAAPLEETDGPSGEPHQNLSVTHDTAPDTQHVTQHVTSVRAAAVMDMKDDDERSDVRTQMQVETARAGGAAGGGGDDQSERSSPSVQSPPRPSPVRTASRLLRKVFGITADVRVRLQRVEEVSAGSGPAESGEEPAESMGTGEDEEDREEDPRLRDPHGDVMDTHCSHFTALSAVEQNCPRGQRSPTGTSRDTESEPVIGYVEPIDEDFTSTDEENAGLRSEHAGTRPQSPTCVDISTRRLGRTRKRTRCLCCVSGSLEPADKSKTERWELSAEQIRRRGRTKTRRRDGRTSARTGCPVDGDGSSSASTDCDELKIHEQIRRLKDLLKEKEAALETMRSRVS
ncbi:LOW QUALITY PROTEIN: ligand-dependent nuclear receptor-interacting factor 1 [Embiotoca jacksoni]|uniref:LOW QUALITY PROTEIN: ligand-dependent nuclear receptor-interacting factor 1 n=1 Tax=Embiotoca jacksoni TaxID=100190 RepID=UPI003704CD37